MGFTGGAAEEKVRGGDTLRLRKGRESEGQKKGSSKQEKGVENKVRKTRKKT